jgi:hypothetical protein
MLTHSDIIGNPQEQTMIQQTNKKDKQTVINDFKYCMWDGKFCVLSEGHRR